MDNKEIIVIEDHLERTGSVMVEFASLQSVSYNQATVDESAKKFVDMLDSRVSCGFCAALAKCLRGLGYQ